MDYYQKHFGLTLDKNKYQIIPNGIRVSDFKVNPGINSRESFRFCYCSCYTRGLIDLLQYVWPIIYQNEPRAEFHVYYGMESVDERTKQQIQYLLGQPGVMDHSRQPMEKIIQEKWKSSFQLYITDTNQEIDCISIRESLVAGCIPLISNSPLFAKREGLHFDLVKTPQGYSTIAQRILAIMHKPEFCEMARQQFWKSPSICTWADVAKQWGLGYSE